MTCVDNEQQHNSHLCLASTKWVLAKNADPYSPFVKHLPQIEEGDLTLILSFVFCPENIADYICYIYLNEFQTTFIMVAMSPDHECVYKSETLIKIF